MMGNMRKTIVLLMLSTVFGIFAAGCGSNWSKEDIASNAVPVVEEILADNQIEGATCQIVDIKPVEGEDNSYTAKALIKRKDPAVRITVDGDYDQRWEDSVLEIKIELLEDENLIYVKIIE